VPARTSDKTPVTSIVPGVTLADYEKAIIEKNLTFTGGIREKTAKILGISERTLYRKIREYNLQ
nr:helix-turn-helix domain-containing protein [Leptospiraceae bacterium]